MHLAVVDPRLLIRAFEHWHSRPAKLVALFAYGQVCLDAAGHPLDESDKLETSYGTVAEDSHLASARAWAERQRDDAIRRKALMEEALEQHTPHWLLLVSSPPLRAELAHLAQEAQGRGQQHVRPDVVIRHTALWTAKSLSELEPAPFYLGADRKSDREYLIHTAVMAEATTLITEDDDLALPGNASHSDPKTRRSVRPYSLDEFVQDVLPYNLDFNAIDAAAVVRAAVRPLSRA
jgi:hypothetical protein